MSEPQIAEEKLRLLFALLFASPEAVNLERIRQVLYPMSASDAAEGEAAVATGEDQAQEHFSPRQHLDALEAWMAERNLPLVLHQVGRNYRILTSEDMAESLQAVRRSSQKESLGPAALEVLALVAYRQPVLKADIDAIRGVKSGSHLRHLLDLRLVRILGRAELPGRPFLYGTSREFLDRFGLRDLEDLPEAGRLANPAEQIAASPEAPAEDAAAPAAEESVKAVAEAVAEAVEKPSEQAEAAASGE